MKIEASETESRIPYGDIRWVAVRCKGCAAEITIDLGDQRQQRVWLEDKVFTCSVCGTNFGHAVKEAVEFLRRAVAAAKASGTDLVIRLPLTQPSLPDRGAKGT